MTVLILVFSELLPKTYAINNPETAARRVAPLVLFFIYIFSPIMIFVRKFVQLLLSLLGLKIDPSKHILASDEIAGAIALHHSEGSVKKDARDRLLGVLDLPERVVEEIMLHRSQIEMVDADDPPKKILEKCLNHLILEYLFLKMIKKMLLVFFMQKICLEKQVFFHQLDQKILILKNLIL